jgi:type I restriction enzyme, S subunit
MTWRSFRLGEVVESVQAGFACGNKSVENGLKHLRMNNIHSEGRLDLSLVRTVPRTLGKPQYHLQEGDVLVCTTNSGKLVGKSALFRAIDEFTFSNHLTRLRLRRDVANPAFVQKQLWLMWLHGEIEPLCKHWVNQSTLPKGELLDLKLSLPDVEIQCRIVNKLDSIIARLDDTKKRLDTIPPILNRLRMSALSAAWKVAGDSQQQLSTVLSEPLRNGRSVPDAAKGFPVLRLTALKQGTVDLSERKVGDWSRVQAAKYLVKSGDFFVARGNGSLRLVGRGGLLETQPDDVAYPDTFIRVRVDQKHLLPQFLRLMWDSPQIRSQLEGMAKTSAGIWKINHTDIENVVLPIPSIAHQKKVIGSTQATLGQLDAIETRYRKARVFAESLMPAVLAKAFRGELV